MAALESGCQARQHSDQMICSRCGLQWDVNDPDPPDCQKSKPAPTRSVVKTLSANSSPDDTTAR